jgi:hypothetical protein
MVTSVWNAIKTSARFACASWHDWRPHLLWLWAVVVLFTVPCFFLPRGADRVQWQAVLFQWAGVLTVAFGLADTRRRLFGKPSLWKELWDRLRRLSYIVRAPPPISANLNAIEAGDAVIAGIGFVRDSVAGTLDERVAALAENQRRIDQTVTALQRDLLNLKHQTTDRIDVEHRERQSADQSIRDQLEEAIIGGIHLEFAGVGFLLIGTLFGTVPACVASVLSKIGL